MAVTGAAVATGLPFGARAIANDKPDLVAVTGDDYAKNVKTAINEYGGIGSVVKKGQTVGVLVNTLGRVTGAYTSPEVIKAVVDLCKEAGAKSIDWYDWARGNRPERKLVQELVKLPDFNYRYISLGDSGLWQTIEVPRGKAIKKVSVFKAVYEPDVLIMIPVMKHHSGLRFTGSLKLQMAVTHSNDNWKIFHREGGRYLEQCIADVNTSMRLADLIVMDATEVMTTNGPSGPGNVIKPRKVVVGSDPVAVDAYCAPLVNVDPKSSPVIIAAHNHGIGEMNLEKLNIREIG